MTALRPRPRGVASGWPLARERRDPSAPWIAGALVLCAVLGVVAGLKPTYALLGVVAIAFVALVFADLVAGIAVFAAASFLDTLSSGGTAFSGTKLIGLVLVVAWLLRGATRADGNVRDAARGVLREHPTVCVWITVFLAWTAVSVLWADSPGAVFTLVYRYALNILLIPIVYSAVVTRRDLVKVLLGYLIGAGFSTLYGFAHPAGASGQLAAGRAVGSLGDANQTAEVLVAALALSVGVWLVVRGAPRLRMLVAAMALLSVIGVVTSLSRSGLFALAAVLVTGVVIGGRWRRPMVWLTGIAVIGVGAYFLAFAPASARQRVTSGSSSGRVGIWTVALRMYSANPVVGVGANNFPIVSRNYLQQPGQITSANYIVTQPKPTHNVYLEQLAELGVFGLITLVGMLISVILTGLRAARIFERLGDRQLELLSRSWIMALMAFLSADFFLPGLTLKQLWLVIALGPALYGLARRQASQAAAEA